MTTTLILPVAAAFVLAVRMLLPRLNLPQPGSPSEAKAEFVPVPDAAALDALFAESATRPVVLYLHDPSCPVSARAYRRIRGLDGPIHFVDVSRQKELNRLVAQRTGIRHESPQAFVLVDGAVRWSASHGEIDAPDIRRALAPAAE